jgi:hypothetical protein
VRRVEARYKVMLPRTAPLVGVACLAVLAIAGAYVLPAGLARFTDGRSLQLPSTTWFASAAPAQRIGGASSLNGQFGAALSTAAARALAPDLPLAAVSVSGMLLAWYATRVRGARSNPALLVAITLALRRGAVLAVPLPAAGPNHVSPKHFMPAASGGRKQARDEFPDQGRGRPK